MSAPAPYRVVRTPEGDTPVQRMPDGRIQVGTDPALYTVSPTGPGEYVVTNGTASWRVFVDGPADARQVWTAGVRSVVEVVTPGRAATLKRRRHDHDLSAPMPARVIALLVEPGQRVEAGDVLVTIEAMKMEMPIRAPRAGSVTRITCQIGDLVQPGVPLVELA